MVLPREVLFLTSGLGFGSFSAEAILLNVLVDLLAHSVAAVGGERDEVLSRTEVEGLRLDLAEATFSVEPSPSRARLDPEAQSPSE